MTQPAQTATYLRRAMKLLGFTNKSLASELTEIRMDGQKTAEATVSRWISGAAAADPGTLLYLKERLIALATKDPMPRLDRCRVVAVGGGKGGCGGSTIAAALTVAARDMGYRTCHVTFSAACNNGHFTRHPASDFDMFSPDDLTNIDWSKYDFAFIDVPSRQYAYEKGLTAETWRLVDLVVLPIDLTCIGATHSAIDACEALDDVPDCPPRLLVQSGSLQTIERIVERIEMIQPWREALFEFPVYVDDPLDFKLDIRSTWKFTSSAAEIAFGGLFEGVCERLDLELPTRPYFENEVRAMELFSLIDLVTKRQGLSQGTA